LIGLDWARKNGPISNSDSLRTAAASKCSRSRTYNGLIQFTLSGRAYNWMLFALFYSTHRRHAGGILYYNGL